MKNSQPQKVIKPRANMRQKSSILYVKKDIRYKCDKWTDKGIDCLARGGREMDWICGPQTANETGRCAADCRGSQLFNQCYFPLTCNNIQVSGLGNINASPRMM